MTKEHAIAELTRAAELCPTTPLAEACRMGALALRIETLRSDCSTCRYKDRMPGVYPCSECEEKYSDAPSKWEPKEVDNGQSD